MTGESNLQNLLRSMRPELTSSRFVFCNTQSSLSEVAHLKPIACFMEVEGLTLVLTEAVAEQNGLEFDGVFRQITLQVHSSLTAVGLTAAVAKQLTDVGISANVIAAYYHDHIFVPEAVANQAIVALETLTDST